MLTTLGRLGAASIALALALFSSAFAADTIKIGSFLSITGPGSYLGDPPEAKTPQCEKASFQAIRIAVCAAANE